MNPHASPWNKPRPYHIQDQQLYWRWAAIKKYISNPVTITENNGILTVVGKDIYIAKNSAKFRLKSHLDWAYYTPKTLAQAIDNNTLDSYYQQMLADHRSDPNEWKDHDEEMELKSFYAAREGRCNLLP